MPVSTRGAAREAGAEGGSTSTKSWRWVSGARQTASLATASRTPGGNGVSEGTCSPQRLPWHPKTRGCEWFSRLRVPPACAACRVSRVACRVPRAACRVPRAACRVPRAQCRVQSAECRVRHTCMRAVCCVLRKPVRVPVCACVCVCVCAHACLCARAFVYVFWLRETVMQP